MNTSSQKGKNKTKKKLFVFERLISFKVSSKLCRIFHVTKLLRALMGGQRIRDFMEPAGASA